MKVDGFKLVEKYLKNRNIDDDEFVDALLRKVTEVSINHRKPFNMSFQLLETA